MSQTLQELQAVAWSLHDLPEGLTSINVLKMPAIFQKIIASIPKRKDEIASLSSLHDTLAASSHSIIAFAPKIFDTKDSYPEWLYTTNPSLSTLKLEKLFEKWLTAIGSMQTIPKSSPPQWIWNTRLLNNADFDLQRLVIPNLVARWLLKQGFTFELSGNTYDLRLVPLVSQRYVTELITEPIIRETGIFSFVLRFWLEQIPYQQSPVLLHKIGVRRWATEEVKIGYRRGKSLYLRRSAGYLDSIPRNDVFTRLTVKRYGNKPAEYAGKQANVFKLLPIGGTVPPIADFLADPMSFQQMALMPIENRDSRYHSIGTGLESSDHREAFEKLTQAMQFIATPMPLLRRVKEGDRVRIIGDAKKYKEDKSNALIKLPYPIRIEVHCENKRGFKRIAEEILEQVHHPRTSTSDIPIQVEDASGNVCLEICHIEDKHLTDMLGKGADEERISYIEQHYPKSKVATGILIELADYRQSKLKNHDPKKAIRDGMTSTGRISQFLQPRDVKNYKHRLKNAVADLLRMLGFRARPFYYLNPKRNLPEQVDLLTFWLFQLNKSKTRKQTVYLPVVAHVPHGYHHMQVIIPSATGRSVCYPSLPKAIQAAAMWSTDFDDPKRVTQFFQYTIEECQINNHALLMIADANLRKYFDELKGLSEEKLSLFGILDENPHIRLVRLRYSANGDAPFCVPPIERSKYQGLYAHRDDDLVFYSLHNVANHRPRSNARKMDYLKKPSQNPSTMMIQLCNLQPDDDPAEWASLPHRLRLANEHINAATVFPQPLHDLEAIKKYIPRHYELIEDDDLNAIEEMED